MTRPKHDPTAAKLEGLEAWLQRRLDWISGHPREVLIGLGAALVLGIAVAGLWEWAQHRETRAQEALASVERRFLKAMGTDPRSELPAEPANREQAQRAREQALEGLEAVQVDHPRSRAAELAALRAAEIEIDLERQADARARLERAVASLDADDPLRAVALRLLAYSFEVTQQSAEAAQIYLRASEVEPYPDRALMLILAGERFETAGQVQAAIDAYQAGLQLDAVLGEQWRVVPRIEALEASMAGAAPASPAPPAAEPAAPQAPGPPVGGLGPETPGGAAAPQGTPGLAIEPPGAPGGPTSDKEHSVK